MLNLTYGPLITLKHHPIDLVSGVRHGHYAKYNYKVITFISGILFNFLSFVKKMSQACVTEVKRESSF